MKNCGVGWRKKCVGLVEGKGVIKQQQEIVRWTGEERRGGEVRYLYKYHDNQHKTHISHYRT